jgi:PilZ domain
VGGIIPYMQLWKRSDPRIPVETLCSEVVDDREHFGVLVELSPGGVRLERPLAGRRDGRIVQLEFELPDADEIIWAKGEVCFDRYRARAPGAPPVRTTGVRLVAAASRHLRMLREWVAATAAARRRALEDDVGGHLALASHWNG